MKDLMGRLQDVYNEYRDGMLADKDCLEDMILILVAEFDRVAQGWLRRVMVSRRGGGETELEFRVRKMLRALNNDDSIYGGQVAAPIWRGTAIRVLGGRDADASDADIRTVCRRVLHDCGHPTE